MFKQNSATFLPSDSVSSITPANSAYDPTLIPSNKADPDTSFVESETQRSGQSRFAVGQIFGDYKIESEIARGGMGVVFRAKQISLNRPVAIKMILSSELATPEQVRRFRSEAELIAQLDHPGIVSIYEVGEEAGQHYFSMALVLGGSLDELVRQGPLNNRLAAQLVKSIAEAIQYAHSRNIVHRDLKPRNVLMDQQGTPLGEPQTDRTPVAS